MKKRLMLSVALVATFSIVGNATVFAQDEEAAPAEVPDFHYFLEPLHASDFGMVPSSGQVDGAPISLWAERFVDWFLTTPFDQHPGPQNDCQAGAAGPVFFLSNVRVGTTQIYQCTVGADQRILVSPGFGFGFGDEPGDTPEAMFDISLDNSMMLLNPEVIVDGRSLPLGGSTWFQRDPFTLELPEGNLFGAPAGSYNGISNGWFVMLEPLAPGEHSIIVRDDTFQPVISPDDVAEGNVVIDDPRGIGETVTATAVFNITVPEDEAVVE
jgi:hypothetical protein